MAEMTSRERILRAIRHQEVDHIPMVDGPWAGTLARWKAEGMPADADWVDYFGYDHVVQIFPDNSPRYEYRVLEKTDRYSIVTTGWGQTQKQFNALDSTPEVWDSYYDSSEKWEEAKARMLTPHEDRINWKYLKENYPKWKAEGHFIQLGLWFGFDVAHSHMIGTENFLIGMLEEPEWAMDVFDTYLTTAMDLAQQILDAGYEVDGVFWYDDMGYKGSSFFSPATYRELLKPFHKKAVDWAHERGLVTELHSCGYIEQLLPEIIETGVDAINPLEIKAGMDPVRLKSKWGDKLAFHGGINAQIWDNPELIRAEMERIIPVMKEGSGYIFGSDHSIPSSVSLENMKQIVALAKELGKY